MQISVPGVSGGGAGDRREVSLALKVSNHYEPNDRYHANIRITSRLASDFRPAANEDIPFLFASWYSPLEE